MNLKEVIQVKLNRLIGVMLIDGVQPSEMADNIYLEQYKKLSYYKEYGHVIGEVVFTEEIGNSTVETTLRYHYTGDKKLYRIEEINQSGSLVEWDRDITESELLNEIVDILKVHYTYQQMEKFIDKLPDHLKTKITFEYSKVA